jgi:hypothetical protein
MVERRCHRILDSPAPLRVTRKCRLWLHDRGLCYSHVGTVRRPLANMLRRDVTSYGLGSADSANGKRYWVLELGN